MKARNRNEVSWRLLVAATVCVVLTVAAASAGAMVMYVYRSAVPTCKSAGCHLFSKAFQASMDTTVDPCQDFGRYVCGRYSHPKNFSVIEAAAQSYRDEVVAPARNASLIGTGQNALQKSWRFYKSCEDVLDNRTDNTAYVVEALSDCGLYWPTPAPQAVNLVKAMVCLSTKMAWPSILDFQADSAAADVVRVTMNPSPYTKELLQHNQGINATAYEAFFDAAVKHFHRALGNTSVVDFTTMYSLEINFAGRFGEEAGPMVFFDEKLPWVQNITTMLKSELQQAMPDRVHRQSKLRLATNHARFVDWLVQQILYRQRDVELVLGWHVVLYVAALTNRQLAILFHELIGGSKDPVWQHKKYCFDLTKKYTGVASILYVSQQRFTDAVRSDVEAMARDVRRTYFGTVQQTTYDWKDLRRVLEFLDVAHSSNIQQIVYSLGDISNNIVENVRSMALRLLHMDESQARGFMSKQLAQTHEEPFPQLLEQRDVSVLPSALMFPYYETDVPLSIKYGAFVSSLAASTAVPYMHMGDGGGVPRAFADFELCARRDGRSRPQLFDLLSASGVEAASNIYEEQSAPDGSEELRLPGLKRLSPSQTFYVSFCYLRCAPDLQKVTCDAALRWHEPFKNAFACPSGSVAGSHHNCRMFRSSAGS